MHTVRYKGYIAQQDKTGVVFVFKGGDLVAWRPCDNRLSGKELRGEVNRYIDSKPEGEGSEQ